MIRVGLRLTLNGGREAAVRLVLTAAAVALGVGLLLVTLAGINAVHAQDARTAWLNSSDHNLRPSVDEATAQPLYLAVSLDQFGPSEIVRVDVAATGRRSPVPPGIPALPGPGEFYASRSLARLMAAVPNGELADRYLGRSVGTIGPAALASPNSLMIIVGHTVADLATAGAPEVRSFETAPTGSPGDPHPARMQLILAVVAGALLIPVLMFIAAATRLAAARREQRFAAMRLVGATPRQIAVIAAVEGAAAAIGGVAAGFAVFLALRPALAAVPFTGQPFFEPDLRLHLGDILLVALGVPVAAAVAATAALRRVRISPLGVTRRTTPPAPRSWRALPLLAGVAELAYFVGRRPSTTSGQIRAYGLGFGLVMIGLVIAGPWLTMAGSRLMANRASRPTTLLAGRRLSDNPRAAFRAVSGLIVALFVSSASLGVITTILAYQATSTGGVAGRDILTQQLGPEALQPGGATANPVGNHNVPASLVAQLQGTAGVKAVVEAHVDPSAPSGPEYPPPPRLVSCEELARLPALGRCAPGATVATLPDLNLPGNVGARNRSHLGNEWPAANVTLAQLQSMPVTNLAVGTDGSKAAIEGARTDLEVAFPSAPPPSTIGDISPAAAQRIAGWKQLADVAIVASLVIAGCSLGVSVASGLVERKRPFSLLRLAGTPLGTLRRVVAIEAALPLLVVAIISAASGLLSAHLFLRSQLSESLRPPSAAYYVAVGLGLAFALGLISATLPLLARITGPDVARNE